ncbi:MAG: PAS domain-containing protein [Planctomycetaceae bacterium]
MEILQFKGDTGLFLAPAPGKASLNLLKMLREGLLVDVRAALLRAGHEQTPVRQEGLRVKSNGGWYNVAVEVIPIHARGTNPGGFLVLFEETSQTKSTQVSRTASAPGQDESATDAVRVLTQPGSPETPDTARLEQELAATRDYLQSLIEHQETANEELQSANEEVQSANEELQSTNEELETSKEEIQSSNEELSTVNDELNNRNTELNRLNNDLVNLFASIQTAIVLVGPDLHVRRFTPAAEKLLNLTSTDIGRPLSAVKHLDDLADLEAMLTEVFKSATSQEHEIRDKQGRWHSLRLRPYRTLENKIDGVIVMLVDIDMLKRAYAYTESIVTTVREPLLVLDANLCVRSASASFYRTYRVTPEQTLRKHLHELGNAQWNIPELRRLLEEVLPQSNEVIDFEVEHDFEQIGIKTMRLNACRLVQVSDHDPLILLAIEDVTEHKKQATELRQLAANLSEADHRKNEFLAMLAHELRNPLAPIRNALQILRVTKGNEQAVQSASEMMDRQVSQLVRLVDDLLDVSRITQGRIELRQARIELASLVYQAIEANRSLYNNLK